MSPTRRLPVVGPAGYVAAIGEARRSAAEETGRVLGRLGATTRDDAVELARGLVPLAEGAAAQMTRAVPPPRPAACTRGSTHCCRQLVPTEMLWPVAMVASLAEARRAEVLGRAEAWVAGARGLLPREAWSLALPCPFLAEDASCLAYAERPLACVGYASTSAAACASGPDAIIERPAAPHHAAAAVGMGMDDAVREGAVRLDLRLVNLAAATSALLRSPGLAQAWLGGARLPARLPEEILWPDSGEADS